MLKCDPESCVSKNNTTIAFGTEPNPRIVLLMKSAFEVGTRLWLKSTFAVGTLKRLRCMFELRFVSDVEMRLPCLIKDARSAFGLRRNPRVRHEACV